MNEFLALFTRASKLLRAAADDAMRLHGVRVGQNIVLEALWEEDGLTPRQVAVRLHMATPTVVNTAKRMEIAGLINRLARPAGPAPRPALPDRSCQGDAGHNRGRARSA